MVQFDEVFGKCKAAWFLKHIRTYLQLLIEIKVYVVLLLRWSYFDGGFNELRCSFKAHSPNVSTACTAQSFQPQCYHPVSSETKVEGFPRP